MKFIRKWLLRTLERARDEHYSNNKVAETMAMAGNSAVSNNNLPKKLSFNVVPATGGVVVTISQWDSRKHEHTESVHVLHQDEDIAINIGHIVSMELLRAN